MATTAAVESYDAVIMKAISVLNQNHARITNSMVKNGSLEDEVANRFAQNTIDGIETHSKVYSSALPATRIRKALTSSAGTMCLYRPRRCACPWGSSKAPRAIRYVTPRTVLHQPTV